LQLQDSLPSVEADGVQLQQLAMNLIINGAESLGEENGVVVVFTGVQQVDDTYLRSIQSAGELKPGRYVFLEVQDNGCGMDGPTVSKIFDPFFTTKFTGRGLGLAAALGIVRGHHGAIKVYSQPGVGSTFKVLLPAREEAGSSTVVSLGVEDIRGSGIVLVVDDEEVVRRTVKCTLQRYGYSVLLAENGQEGVDVFREMHDRIAAVVLDMTMPVMGGEEALRRMKAVARNVPVILSSGFNEVEAVRRFTGKGLAGFIQKPYTSRALVTKLKEARERPREM
jgi:CheY-like chemotaxis protein